MATISVRVGDAEQSGRGEVGHRLIGDATQLFGLLRALRKDGYECRGTAQELVACSNLWHSLTVY